MHPQELSIFKQAVISEMNQNPDAAWQAEKAKDIAQPLRKGKQGGWREILTPSDRKIFEQIAGTTLSAWNYPVETE